MPQLRRGGKRLLKNGRKRTRNGQKKEKNIYGRRQRREGEESLAAKIFIKHIQGLGGGDIKNARSFFFGFHTRGKN